MNDLPDILADDLDVVFCGLNPGMQAASAGHHFVGRGNRFWQVLYPSGFTRKLFVPTDDRLLLAEGCGLTAMVARPTASADEISVREFTAEAEALKRKIRTYKPRWIALLGKKAYAAMVGRSSIDWGRPTEMFGGSGAWCFRTRVGATSAFRWMNWWLPIANSEWQQAAANEIQIEEFERRHFLGTCLRTSRE
jgi:TDG/mug DNA glycosylase family protein